MEDLRRSKLERLVKAASEWNGLCLNLQAMTDTEYRMQLCMVCMVCMVCTAAPSSLAFDLLCKVRESIIEFMQREHPHFS